ncbi:MAG: sigma-54-dependent Fis family transcriptional regulator [Gammaproteobacteria bacterium]
MDSRQQLINLEGRLQHIRRLWTVDNYEALLNFYVEVLPNLLRAERCGIFLVIPGTGKIRAEYGTGLEGQIIEAPKEDSLVGRAVSSGESVIDNDLASKPGYHEEAARATGFVTRSLICVPIRSVMDHKTVTGAIEVLNKLDGSFTEDDRALLERIAHFLSMAMESIVINREMLRISDGLNKQVSELRSAQVSDVSIIAESPSMRAVLELAATVSATPVNVFIQGENGTGKELIARMIHRMSKRKDQSFVAVNCASIPESLVESEFFGYEKGAFTGAAGSRKGRFEEAEGGILFLDEIAEMPTVIQPKFLRALQEGEGHRLGSNKLYKYDVRIISATNKNLLEEVREGRFREDLFYRLFSVEIRIPPLRERREDIIPMALAFQDETCRRFEKTVAGFSREVLDIFEAYKWPGNVRQLRREVERLVALTPDGAGISSDFLSPELRMGASDGGGAPGTGTLPDQVRDLEIKLIRNALADTRGNKLRASRILGITRQGLDKKLKRYDIDVDTILTPARR